MRRAPILDDDRPLIESCLEPGVQLPADEPMTCTEWDKFHRVDIGLQRAVAGVPMARELFDICQEMDNMFGSGEGQLLLRIAKEAAGSVIKRGALPGITRKVVALAREPGQLLDNFRSYVAGLHLRELWRQEGHATYSKKELTALGNRLSSPAFVAFTILSHSMFKGIVAPFALVFYNCLCV